MLGSVVRSDMRFCSRSGVQALLSHQVSAKYSRGEESCTCTVRRVLFDFPGKLRYVAPAGVASRVVELSNVSNCLCVVLQPGISTREVT